MLSRISITNFRSFRVSELRLHRFTPVVGYNNAGKSNLQSAIRWWIDPFKLTESDFNDPSSPVIVEGELTDIDETVMGTLQENHRERIMKYRAGNSVSLRRICSAPGTSTNEFELQLWNPTGDGSENGAWEKSPTGIANAVKALFPELIQVHAMVDAGEDAAKYKSSTTIGGLLNRILNPVRHDHQDAINEVLAELDEWFGREGQKRPDEFNQFDLHTTKILSDTFPDVSLRLDIPIPTLDDLFKAGTLKAKEDDRDGEVDISELGHGTQRAIQMSLIRYLAQVTQGVSPERRVLLLIEEPELYLHPHAIEKTRSALATLSMRGYQVLCSTHSAHMITSHEAPNALLLRKTGQFGTFSRLTMASAAQQAIADAPSQSRILFSLANSSQILFADRAMLVEGEAEFELLPAMYTYRVNRTIGEDRIAIANVHGKNNIRGALAILDAMDMPVIAVVDLDYAFDGAVQHGFINKDDDDLNVAREIFRQLSHSDGIVLNENGFPRNPKPQNGEHGVRSEEAYALFAVNSRARSVIESMYQKLRHHKVWLWNHGSIEHHLGIDKTADARADFINHLRANGSISKTTGHDHICDLIELVREEI